MAPPKLNPEERLHADWLGMLQPDGLVFSVPVLAQAQVLSRRAGAVQEELRQRAASDVLPDGAAWMDWLGWPAEWRDGPRAQGLSLDLVEVGATLTADLALVDGEATLALVKWSEADWDAASPGPWPLSEGQRFERLLTTRGVAVGLLLGPDALRLVYAPPGEAPGRLTFPLVALLAADGRVLVDALHSLLGAQRLWNAPPGKGLLDLLRASRSRQDDVTTALAGQVVEALQILIRGFDAANARTDGALLRGVDPAEIQDGLTTVMLRLVFLLYAEDRGLLPMHHPVYEQHYAVTTLAGTLAAESVAHGQAMDRRLGAWARLCSLFRLVYTGARHQSLHLPPRRGDLFDPGQHGFLEGRRTTNWQQDAGLMPPVDDLVIHEVLHRLTHQGGQRLSYRNLEVEQIGSVYEGLMGYALRRAGSRAVTLRGGAVVELRALSESPDPLAHVAELVGDKPGKLATRLAGLPRSTPEGGPLPELPALEAALGPLVDGTVPALSPGEHYLALHDARRSSGSHYTPRSLTEPIVAETLGPLLDRKGVPPSPEDVLALKVCDPAMGSGAFLAEACRYLARRLADAWARTGQTPASAQEGDVELVARRMIVERCLYGVDKNPRAVQLARLSLWLVTSAKELPFTFVDHTLKVGDALVGLEIGQMAAFAFEGAGDASLWSGRFEAAMSSATRVRSEIWKSQLSLQFGHDQKKTYLQMADDEVWDERRVGDLLVASAWMGGTATAVTKRQKVFGDLARRWYPNDAKEPLPDAAAEGLAALDADGLRPFHWPLEFPEVFVGKRPGFDAVVGNPPFGGKNTISAESGAGYIPLLQRFWPHAHGAADLAAYFFLRVSRLLKKDGTFGLVATNTIAQGNTRDTGLQHLIANEGVNLFAATVDLTWPVKGAAVVVDVVHGIKGKWTRPVRRNGVEVSGLSSALAAGEELPDPVPLDANAGKGFQGTNVLGLGFTLTPSEAEVLLARDPRNREIIKPYLGGQELNNDPDLSYDRWVIDFGDRTLDEAEAWPELIAIVREKVKPERDNNNRDVRRRYWWHFAEKAPGLYAAIKPTSRCLACSRVSKHLMFAFQSVDRVFSDKLVVFALDDWFSFGVLQSRVHEHWAWTLSTTMKLDLSYTPSRCFQTFPFPTGSTEKRAAVATAGEALYAARWAIMQADRVGMTTVWNRLMDPMDQSPEILDLREKRDALDRAVLRAYGWDELDVADRDGVVGRLRKLNAARKAAEGRGT